MFFWIGIYFFFGATIQFFCELQRAPTDLKELVKTPLNEQLARLIFWPIHYPYQVASRK